MQKSSHNPQVYHDIGKTMVETDAKKDEAFYELEKTLGESRDVLVKATGAFPFTLFPDTITVDRTKITVTHRNFFWAGEVISIAIEDILNIAASVGPFLGSIHISSRFFSSNKPYTIYKFWRGDALKVARIVEGYLIARQKEIDTSMLSTEELTKKLDELGQSKTQHV